MYLLLTSSIMLTRDVRPPGFAFCIFDLRLAILADSSWHALVGHQTISVSHASGWQLWCLFSSPCFIQWNFETPHCERKCSDKYFSTRLDSKEGLNLYRVFISLWTCYFSKWEYSFHPSFFKSNNLYATSLTVECQRAFKSILSWSMFILIGLSIVNAFFTSVTNNICIFLLCFWPNFVLFLLWFLVCLEWRHQVELEPV